MPFIAYVPKRFHPKSEKMIAQANEIIGIYQDYGLDLTLRQLYYQFVARDWIPNTFRSYKNLQELVNQARLAGRIDWNAIEDRTRNVQEWPVQPDALTALQQATRHYREDKWADQPTHVEVWVEKDAMLGVAEMACAKWETPFFSCRGYTSQSEVWNSAQRLMNLGKPAVILHLGDHDPSGLDMTRDIQDRMDLFEAENVVVERIALNMDQIKRFGPPPNPAKLKDSRAKEYIKQHGPKSWELDSLDPKYIVELVETETAAYVDDEIWEKSRTRQEKERDHLQGFVDNFDVATRFVANPDAIARFEESEEDQ